LRRLLAVLLLAASVPAKPGRQIRYAESTDRLVYAFVFGSKDTCRVIRRPQPPPFGPDDPRTRLPDGWKGGAGETLLGEFGFGRYGRPLHIGLTNDGKYLLAFANRAGPGLPEQDAVWTVAQGEHTLIEYEGLSGVVEPEWPAFERALARMPPLPKNEAVLSYSFVSKEVVAGRVLVARQSEDADGRISEMTSFVLFADKAEARPPAPGELIEMLKDPEPLFRAGAAHHIGLAADRESQTALKASLQSTQQDAARCALAAALVRCGDRGAHKTLRALLLTEPEAAYQLALLPPDAGDVDALAAVLPRLADRPALHVSVALARNGERGARALKPSTRSRDARERERAAIVLGHIDDVTAERTLLKMVGDGDEAVRKAAARALTDPPRQIMESNYAEFAKALAAAGKTETKSAAYRLATLAMHAKLDDPRILAALVDLTRFHERASLALRKLTGLELQTSDDWQRWWKERK